MCPAGTFGPTVGANSVDACVNCPIGTYQDMDGSYECLVCDENTFASAPGATQCTACGDGYQVSGEGSNFCNPCSAGTYRLAAESETCQPCRPGSSSGQGACGMAGCLAYSRRKAVRTYKKTCTQQGMGLSRHRVVTLLTASKLCSCLGALCSVKAAGSLHIDMHT
jgi:hypothetical protein